LSARRMAGVLAECEFTSKFLRSLAELAPTSEREARLLDEYRRALRRMDYARERMVLSNMKLVIWHARKYRATCHLSLSDLIQEGAIGLMKAAVKFDPTRGFKFATYGLWWIRQSITRAIADQARTIRIPVHAIESISKVSRTVYALGLEGVQDPTPEQIAEKAAMPLDRVRKTLRVPKTEPVALDCLGPSKSDVGEIIDHRGANPFDNVFYSTLRSTTTKVLLSLTPREERVLRMRFGIGLKSEHTLEEVGEQFGVTRERIRQIEAKALRKMRHPSRSRKLQNFLDN
jgi:RNA polymerase primary sigma factor